MSTYPKRLETLLAERQAQLSAFYRTDEKIRQNLVMAKARIAAQSKRLARATKRLGRAK